MSPDGKVSIKPPQTEAAPQAPIPPSMNMNTQGIQANICCWTGSVGAGFSFCCSHIEMPRRIGKRPMKTRCMIDPVTGASQGRSPKALKIEDCAGKVKTVPPDHSLILSARRVGTNFGD